MRSSRNYTRNSIKRKQSERNYINGRLNALTGRKVNNKAVVYMIKMF